MTASALPDGPAIVVLDEFPWLCESNPSLEGTLQAAWDRLFEPKPVLFILIGSDIAMMEALTTYERPLFGRAKEMVVNPFKLGDTAAMIGVEDPAVAIDAQLITGGYPRLCIEWRDAPDVTTFFGRQLADENSDLIDVGRNVLGAEFPPAFRPGRYLPLSERASGPTSSSGRGLVCRQRRWPDPCRRSRKRSGLSQPTVRSRPDRTTTPGTASLTPTSDSGCASSSRHCRISQEAVPTWRWRELTARGWTTAARRWNR